MTTLNEKDRKRISSLERTTSRLAADLEYALHDLGATLILKRWANGRIGFSLETGHHRQVHLGEFNSTDSLYDKYVEISRIRGN